MNRLSEITDHDLITLYKHSMQRDYFTIRGLQGFYHPAYEYNVVTVPASPALKASFFYSSHSMSLLTEMWRRHCEGTFYEQAFWASRNLFYTKISIQKQEQPVVKKSATLNKVKSNDEFIVFEGENHILLGQGSKRKVYVSKDRSYVIKIPMKPERLGIEENIVEANTYNKCSNSIYAKCESVGNNWLKMEYVEPAFLTKQDNFPDWVSKIPEGQVGHNKDGKLVAYDYGSEI